MRKPFAVTLVFLAVAVSAAAGASEHKPYTRNVAIVVYENAEPLDWTGPFEVYNDAASFGESSGGPAFNVYVVSKTTDTLNSQGMKVVPNYSIANAPKPDIVVFPGGPSNNITGDPEFFAWSRQASTEAEIAQSVCTGAFVLAKAGLLDGLDVTTFHGAIENLRKSYPNAHVQDGRRFIDNGHVVTTAGISAGIDGSLNVVARLLGRRVADQVATYMEYHWTPEAYLATKYSYLNPSTDEHGRMLQTAQIQREDKNETAAAKTYRAVLSEDGRNREAWYGVGDILRGAKDHLGAAEAFANSAANPSGDRRTALTFYDAASEYALAGHREEALAMLASAFAAGYPNRDAVQKDPNLAILRDDPRTKTIPGTD